MPNHQVLVLMGSVSDRNKMEPVAETLDMFGVHADVRVLSAHRNPKAVQQLVSSARDEGYKGVIAGAGMAAHLAGACAAHTTLPVIGIPLSGGGIAEASLFSTVQMPKGMPVATVAVDGAVNAALLMVQILAVCDSSLEALLVDDRAERAGGVA